MSRDCMTAFTWLFILFVCFSLATVVNKPAIGQDQRESESRAETSRAASPRKRLEPQSPRLSEQQQRASKTAARSSKSKSNEASEPDSKLAHIAKSHDESSDQTAAHLSGTQHGDQKSSPDGYSLILMRNGSIVQGQIYSKGEDYLLAQPHGQVFIPGSMVQTTGKDIEEIYEFLLGRAATQSQAEAYLVLGKWCQTHRLFKHAKEAFETCLNLDPNQNDARHLLVLNREFQKEADEETERKVRLASGESLPSQSQSKPRAFSNPSDDGVATLGGLSPELAVRFNRKIQPILTSGCSTTRCHGPNSDTEFKLQRVTSSGHSNRSAVERNLASILNFIDRDQPLKSALLTKPQGQQCQTSRPLFQGKAGKSQLAELQSWVKDVSRELGPEQKITENNASESPPARLAPPKALKKPGVDSTTDSVQATSGNNGPDPKKSQPRNRGVRQALNEESHDAFDPEVFNRAVRPQRLVNQPSP